MEKVLRNFQTAQFIRAIMKGECFREKVNTNGTMAKFTKEIGGRENAMAQESGAASMEIHTRDNGA